MTCRMACWVFASNNNGKSWTAAGNGLSNKELLDDFQRTILLIDPGAHQQENRIWVYHWTVSNELKTRSERTLMRALKIAEEQ